MQTDFRAEVDGFAFDNTWTLDASERGQVHAVVDRTLPLVVSALTPVLLAASPAVLAAFGPALLLAGPLLPFLLPVAIRAAVDKIGDAIADNATTWCGGIAFTAMDYWLQGWVVPRGLDKADHPQPAGAAGATPASVALRAHLWGRLLQCQLDNLEKAIVWHFMKAFMEGFGDDYVHDGTRDAAVQLVTTIANGRPGLVYLVHADLDPSVDHVVVVTGLESSSQDQWTFAIYDVETPDTPASLDIDARNSPVRVSIVTHLPGGDSSRSFDGLFVPDYTPQRPPVSVVATTPLAFDPGTWVGQGRPFSASFDAASRGFRSGLRLHLAVGAAGGIVFEEPGATHGAGEDELLPMNAPASGAFASPGVFPLMPEVLVWPASHQDGVAGVPPSVRRLPHPDGSAVAPVDVDVTPRLAITATTRSHDACAPVFVAGAEVQFHADLLRVAVPGVAGLAWTFSGWPHSATLQQDPWIRMPPAPGVKIHVDVTVALNDGTEAFGSLDAVTFDPQLAARMTALCHLRHVLEQRLIPTIWNSPGDPARDPAAWFHTPEGRRALDPLAFVRQVEEAVGEMKEMLRPGE